MKIVQSKIVEEKTLREAYKNLLNDMDFERLELELNKPNIFSILSVGKAEIRHSNFLGWLLNPNESHGLGKLFLMKFLRDIATSDVVSELDEIEIETVNYNKVEIRREWKNIDLLLIIDQIVVCVENKFYSQDHSNQLSKYRSIIGHDFPNYKKAFVYLTPAGEPPRQQNEKEFYANYSYEEIISHTDRILEVYGENIHSGVKNYIQDYITTIKRELMKSDIANELANKLFKNHRDLFNFILEHKTDQATDLFPIFEAKLKESGWIEGSRNKGYIRFLTPALDKIIPRNGVGWPRKESFLFEIDFFWTKRKAVFKTVIAPGSDETNLLIKNAIETLQVHKMPSGKKWLVHFIISWELEKEEGVEINSEEIQKNLNVVWPKITDVVQKVENAILSISDELSEIQQDSV